jgi:tetratricopeptide (TPR) repeat protein
MTRLRTVLTILIALATCLPIAGWQPHALAAKPGVVLKPKNQQQLEASQLLVQGSQLLKAKQPFKARPLMERAAALWPDEPHVHFNLGACYSEMGDFPRAIGEYQRAMTLDDSMAECLPDIATCYQLMNEYSQAEAYFTEYLRRRPHADDGQQVRGMISALHRQSNTQVDSDPLNSDYIGSVYRHGCLERWGRQRLPLRVFISNGTDDHGRGVTGFNENFNEILLNALDTWVKASNYRLAYTLVDDARSADIICTWTDKKDFLRDEATMVEQGAARLASAPVPGTTDRKEILQARVIILVRSPASGKVISDEEMKKTCLHELGHAFGLSGHSNNNTDIMFFSESPTVWAALTKRDKNTISRLYGDYPVFSWPAVAGR